MNTWNEFCAEPKRHQTVPSETGGEVFRFINQSDYEAIQADALEHAAEIAQRYANDGYNAESVAGAIRIAKDSLEASKRA